MGVCHLEIVIDTLSRNNSDSEQSKEGTNGLPQKQSDNKTDLLGNTRLSETNGNYTFPTPISTPKDENKQLDVDVEPSTSLQNLSGTVEPTTNVDTTPIIVQPSLSPSNSVTSLKIEHFDREFDDELTTPIAGDIASQIPHASNATLPERSDSLLLSDSNSSRKFRLPTKSNTAKSSKQRKRPSGNVLDEGLIDSPPLNGYVPAAPRRNVEFHALFRSVQEEDFLINDYGCALQKEILVQGRLYVSANHVCFNANIFGWVTNLVIAFSDIVSIEKRMTAYVIPNAIQITTLHARHFFTTFLSRDSVYDLLFALWKQTHPSLPMTSYTESEYGTSQKCSDASETSGNGFSSSEDGDDEGKSTTSQRGPRKRFALPRLTLDPMRLMRGSTNSTLFSDDDNTLQQEKVDNLFQSLPPSPKQLEFINSNEIAKGQKLQRQRSKSDVGLQLFNTNIADSKRLEKYHPISPRNQSRHTANNNIKKRRSTQCACLKKGQHYDNVSLDTKFTGSVEKIFNLLFTSEFLKRYLTEEEKCTDLEIGEWNTESYTWSRSQSYIKPLNNSIGPKSTKCIIKEECQHRDFDNYVTNASITTTPDVPSGNSFCVKNRICIMWAGANESRLIVTCSVEWSKSSWLKGTIERACVDGQQTYWKELAQAIKKYIAAHPSEFREESGTPVQEETVDSEAVDEKASLKRAHTRPKDRTRPTNTEISDLQENEPVTVQHHNNIWNDVTNIVSSILSSLIQNISIPSTNVIILLILLILVINNINNWLTLRNIGHKLDGLNNKRGGELFSKSYEYRDYTPLFFDRFENEGDDPLWQWLQERSKMYDETDKEKSASDSEQTDHTTALPSSQILSDYGHHFNSRPISSQSLHDQIGDIYKLIQVAEEHVKKLADVAEFESSYHKHSEDNTSRQQYSDEF
ncbi:GRAM domain protein [Rhizophagus clarus]|uniref:GRAM domain protein n=1 Tax=Rhizophagus clarus TaxID=94130 RepID=A0A8H3LH95_9GLOM|nr:GRAM domain protein [Rhizophagus clarus]